MRWPWKRKRVQALVAAISVPYVATERISETFRGVNCKKNAFAWRDARVKEGWVFETFSGVSGVGAYKSCSITMKRAVG